jgi:predicted metal-dependent peptidase
VQSEVIVKNDGRGLLDKVRAGTIRFQGGGGTDFAPAIARLNHSKVSVALYFTDMAGHFGTERPVMPLLWCSTSPGQSAPFGRVIYLDGARRI